MRAIAKIRNAGISVCVFGLAGLTGCVPLASRPTLDDVRLGQVQGAVAEDVSTPRGDVQAEVLQLDKPRQELRVRTTDGARRVLSYDRSYASATYHGRDYSVEQLESGDIITFETSPRNSDRIARIHIQTPVQARSGIASSPRFPPPPRPEVVEGTVAAVQYDRGFFDLQPRSGGPVKVSVPYNARRDDVASFQSLRRGDYVRVEGEFIGPDTFQMLSFVSPRDRR